MHEDQREIRRLEKLLTTTRLTESDRQAIQARIQELMSSAQKPSEAITRPLSPYLLGTFDRPAPAPPSQGVSGPITAPQPEPQKLASSQPPSEVNSGDSAREERPLPSVSPEEIESRCKLLADIADRIAWLRAFRAVNLSFEVAREAENWLSKLQEIAGTIPKEEAERALGRHVGLLTQPVQAISRPQIPERLQERILAPSAPNSRNGEVMSEIYFHLHAYDRAEPQKQRPPNSVPGGLDQFIL
jgi:hypothetical protein